MIDRRQFMQIGTASLVAATTDINATGISGRHRARDLGVKIGRMRPGAMNGITDVAGVEVGHTTIICRSSC